MKKQHLEDLPGSRGAIRLTTILLDEDIQSVYYLAAMIYDISEEGQPNSEELIEELLIGAFKGPSKELEEELIGNPITKLDIIDQIRDAAEKDNVMQRITGAVRAG